jgi:hypothetical protein
MNSQNTSGGSTLLVRRSELHGNGVFARRFIAAGESVVCQEGIQFEAEELKEDIKAIQIGPSSWLLADPENPHESDEINHSCEPNLGFVDGSLMLYAIRDILPGEEVTFDYASAMADPHFHVHHCRCGSARCRKEITSFPALDAETQEKIRPIALQYLRQTLPNNQTANSESRLTAGSNKDANDVL